MTKLLSSNQPSSHYAILLCVCLSGWSSVIVIKFRHLHIMKRLQYLNMRCDVQGTDIFQNDTGHLGICSLIWTTAVAFRLEKQHDPSEVHGAPFAHHRHHYHSSACFS